MSTIKRSKDYRECFNPRPLSRANDPSNAGLWAAAQVSIRVRSRERTIDLEHEHGRQWEFQSASALASERYLRLSVIASKSSFQSASALASERYGTSKNFAEPRIVSIRVRSRERTMPSVSTGLSTWIVSIRVRSRERTIYPPMPKYPRSTFQSASALASERFAQRSGL